MGTVMEAIAAINASDGVIEIARGQSDVTYVVSALHEQTARLLNITGTFADNWVCAY
jgi:hypothetical protein